MITLIINTMFTKIFALLNCIYVRRAVGLAELIDFMTHQSQKISFHCSIFQYLMRS